MDLRSLLGGLLTPDSADAPAPLPMDPMDQALPPHLRQFYGSPGSAPSLPPPALNRPQPGQTETPREIPLQEKAMAAARSAYNDVMSGAGSMTEGLLGPIARGADAVGGVLSDVNSAAHRAHQDANERIHTRAMGDTISNFTQATGDRAPPPLPPRDREDPYYGKEYPSLKHPRPGQDFDAPGSGPVRGEEVGWPYYTPQIERPIFGLRGRPPVRRT
jgi:hypothetical protein